MLDPSRSFRVGECQVALDDIKPAAWLRHVETFYLSILHHTQYFSKGSYVLITYYIFILRNQSLLGMIKKNVFNLSLSSGSYDWH